jgi:hypothetical protein
MTASFLRPPDDANVVYEFFAPFAHVPGKYEWCRIRSPTHGTVDCFILLGASTSVPATVFVNSVLGQQFMAERYPECTTIRVPPSDLTIAESGDGGTVTGKLRSSNGPVKEVDMTLRAPSTAVPRQVPYGGEGKPVWGGRWTCWGVDLVLDGSADGKILAADGKTTQLRGTPCIVTRGSFGRIAPLK